MHLTNGNDFVLCHSATVMIITFKERIRLERQVLDLFPVSALPILRKQFQRERMRYYIEYCAAFSCLTHKSWHNL